MVEGYKMLHNVMVLVCVMYYVVTGTLRPLEPLGCLHRFSHELKVLLPVPTMPQSFEI